MHSQQSHGLRQQISEFLNFSVPDVPVPFTTHDVLVEQGYTRSLISYEGAEGDRIPAFLLLPEGDGVFTAVVVLAPDSICFEDRRHNRTGTGPDELDDVAQHFNEMCYRLLGREPKYWDV